jgi:hypothetical protein
MSSDHAVDTRYHRAVAHGVYRALKEAAGTRDPEKLPPALLAAALQLLRLMSPEVPLRLALVALVRALPVPTSGRGPLEAVAKQLEQADLPLLDAPCAQVIRELPWQRREPGEGVREQHDHFPQELHAVREGHDQLLGEFLSMRENQLFWLLRDNGGEVKVSAAIAWLWRQDAQDVAAPKLDSRLRTLQKQLNRKLRRVGLPTVKRRDDGVLIMFL